MPYLVSEAFDYNDFVKQVRGYAQGHPQLSKSDPKAVNSGVTITGTGDGTLYITSEAATPTVTYRLVCTVAGSEITSPKAQFNVFRTDTSPHTSLGTLTVSERFTHGGTGLGLILRTATDWVVSDTVEFTLAVHNLSTLESPNSFGNWVEDRFTQGTADGNGDFVTEWIAHAPTVAGAGQSPETPMHFGMKTVFDFTDNYYNVALGASDGFEGSSAFDQQPNFSGSRYMLLGQNPFKFWLVADSDCLITVARISSVYQWGYLGLISMYATGTQHPKPMFVGAMSEVSSAQPSSTDNDENAAFWNPGPSSTALFRWTDGSWYEFLNRGPSYSISSSTPLTNLRMIWPYRDESSAGYSEKQFPLDARGLTTQQISRFDGTYEQLPITLIIESPQFAVVGELKHLKFIPGFAISAEDVSLDTSVSPQVEGVIFSNANLSGRQDFAVLELID